MALVLSSSVRAEPPTVVRLKMFSRDYPSNCILGIPMHGCVDLSRPLPPDSGEDWLSLGHLTKHQDFDHIEVLVQSDRSILGGRAVFKGSQEEWSGKKGCEARKLVLFCFQGGDGPPLSDELPLAFDGSDFGAMIFTFDLSGHVTWRKVRGAEPDTEEAHVAGCKQHSRECKECRNIYPEARVVLPFPPIKETTPSKDKEIKQTKKDR